MHRGDWPLQALLVDGATSPGVVAGEVARLRWIGTTLPVPRVLATGSFADGRDVAVLKYPVGSPASSPENRVDPGHSVQASAKALRMLHRTDPTDFPYDSQLDALLATIAERLSNGEFNPGEMSGPYQRFEPARLVEILHESRPAEDRVAFGHGAFGLHAVLLDNPDEPGGDVTGITDWALAGMCDPYLDLALGARSVASVFGAELVPLFFSSYGLEHPDPLRVDYFSLLAEFLS